jgi:tetratricopeptide (TPR) repeat protein
MNKFFLTLICIFFFEFQLSSQTINCTYVPENENFTRIYDKINFRSNNNENYEAINLIDRMLEPTGLKSNFIPVRLDGLDNCAAINLDGLRFIAYDEVFLKALNKFGKTDWIKVSIFAHEIGHHLNGHTLTSSTSVKEQILKELEADEFSGFLLQKLGATLGESLAGINLLGSIKDSETHPSKERRLSAIKKGYDNALNQDKKLLRLNEQSKAEDYLVNANSLLNKFLESYYSRIHIQNEDKNLYKDEIQNLNDVLSKTTIALELNPNLAISYFYRANVYFYLEDYSKAIRELLKTESLGYKSVNFYHLFADMLCDVRMYKDALTYINKSIDYDKKNSSLSTNLTLRSIITWELNLKEECFNDLSKLIEYYSKNNDRENLSNTFYNRGNKYTNLKQFENAILDYDKAIEYNPLLASAYCNRSNSFANLGKYDKALEDINKAININPKPKYFYTRADKIFFPQKKYNEAITDYDIYIKLEPNYAHTYYLKGLIFSLQHRYSEAIKLFEKAIELVPKDISDDKFVVYEYEKIDAYIGLGEFNTALREINEMIFKFDSELKTNDKEQKTFFYLQAYRLKATILYNLKQNDYCKYFRMACELGDNLSCDNFKKLNCK